MKKLKICFIFFMAAFVCLPAKAQEKHSAPARVSAEKWLIQKSGDLLNILSVQDAKSRYLKLRRFCKEVFNQKEMPRLAMGKYWKEMSPRQQEELQRLFFDYFVVTYGSFSFHSSNVFVRVTETVPQNRDLLMKVLVKMDLDVKEKAAVPQNEKHPVADLQKDGAFEIMFALRQRAGGYYVRDAKLEGQSILMFLRSHLEQEYKKADSDMEKLLENVRKKINDRYRAAEDLAKKNPVKE